MPLTRSAAKAKAAADAAETEAVGGAKVTSKDAATKVNSKDAAPKATKFTAKAAQTAVATRIPLKSIENNSSKSAASTSTSTDVDTPLDTADATFHLSSNNEPRVTDVDLADLEECMHHASGMNPKVLEMLIELGDIAIDILCQHGKARSVEEIMQTEKVKKEHQEAYGKRKNCIKPDTIDYNESWTWTGEYIAVYLILRKDSNGNWVAVKSGTNGNGCRSRIYIISDTQRCVDIASFFEGSDELKERLVKELHKHLVKLIKSCENDASIPLDLCLVAEMCEAGALDYGGLLRDWIMRAVESSYSKKFHIADHLDHNPHELAIGTAQLVKEVTENHNQISNTLSDSIQEVRGDCEATFFGIADTWVPDYRCFPGGLAISAQIQASKFIIDGVPVSQKLRFDTLTKPPEDKKDPGNTYDTNYKNKETDVGIAIATEWQERVANTKGGIAVALRNEVVFRNHETCNDFKGYFISECGWKEKHTFQSKRCPGARIHLLYKNRSVMLVINSPGLAFHPEFYSDIQEEILYLCSILRCALRRQDWKDKNIKCNFEEQEGILAPLVSQRLKILGLDGHDRSHILKYLYVYGDTRKLIFTGQLDNLRRTTRVTSIVTSSWIRTSMKDKDFYHRVCVDKEKQNFVKEKLKEKNIKKNIVAHSLTDEDLYLSRIEPIIHVLCSLYDAKGTAEEGELLSLFQQMTAQYSDGEQIKNDRWNNRETKEIMNVLRELCDLDASLKSIPNKNGVSAAGIAAKISTRNSKQVVTFLNGKKKQLGDATIRDLLAYLQNIVDFEIEDNHVIKDGSGHYNKIGLEGNARFQAIIHSEIQGHSVKREALQAVLAKVEETTLEFVDYNVKTGKFSPASGDAERKIITSMFQNVWGNVLKQNRRK